MSAVAESEFGNTASDRAFANNGDLWTMSQPVVFQFRNPQYVCCMECWVAWMDAGMQQLTEKEPSR